MASGPQQFIEIDAVEFEAAVKKLEVFQQPNFDHVLWSAALSAARIMRDSIKAQDVPIKTRGGKKGSGYGDPGDLRSSIKLTRVKQGRAGGGIAYAVGPMGRRAFMRYWVIRGTKPHDEPVRSTGMSRFARGLIHHPGDSHPNPFVSRAIGPVLPAAREAMAKTISKAAQKEQA